MIFLLRSAERSHSSSLNTEADFLFTLNRRFLGPRQSRLLDWIYLIMQLLWIIVKKKTYWLRSICWAAGLVRFDVGVQYSCVLFVFSLYFRENRTAKGRASKHTNMPRAFSLPCFSGRSRDVEYQKVLAPFLVLPFFVLLTSSARIQLFILDRVIFRLTVLSSSFTAVLSCNC